MKKTVSLKGSKAQAADALYRALLSLDAANRLSRSVKSFRAEVEVTYLLVNLLGLKGDWRVVSVSTGWDGSILKSHPVSRFDMVLRKPAQHS